MDYCNPQDFLEYLFDGVYYVDRDRKISYWNQAAEKITGYTKEEVIGSFCFHNILRHIDELGSELCLNGCPLNATILDGKMREHLVYLHHKEGHRLPVFVRATPLRNQDNEIVGAIEIFQVKTDKDSTLKEIEKVKKESLSDALCQVGNRRYAELLFKTRFYELNNLDVPFGIIFFDIDNFKQVNDRYGHTVGDEILKMVTKTVQTALRGPDTVIRWGGDEFLVILPNVGTQAVLEMITNRIKMFINRSYLMKDEKRITVNLSIGATIAQNSDSQESLVSRADALMYQGKQNGKNKIVIG